MGEPRLSRGLSPSRGPRSPTPPPAGPAPGAFAVSEARGCGAGGGRVSRAALGSTCRGEGKPCSAPTLHTRHSRTRPSSLLGDFSEGPGSPEPSHTDTF